MATTFAELIEERYRAMIAQASITDLSTVRGEDGVVDPGTGEDEARTTAVCEMIADLVEMEIGEIGASGRIAQQASALAVQQMNLIYSGVLSLVVTPEKQAALDALVQRLIRYANGLRLEIPGVVSDTDKTAHDDTMDRMYPSTNGAGETSVQSTILNG